MPSLKKRVLIISLSSHCRSPRSPQTKIFTKGHFYWHALTVYCYATVLKLSESVKTCIMLHRNIGSVMLFLEKALLKAVTNCILGELIHTPGSHRYSLVVMDLFTKVVKFISMNRASADEVAKPFFDNCVFNYGSPTELLSNNLSHFTSKFFMEVCRIHDTNNSFTTLYNPQTNKQPKRFTRIILASLRS